MTTEQIEREARKVRIGICACGGDFTCTPHRAIAALCTRVDTEARREQRELDEKIAQRAIRGNDVMLAAETGIERAMIAGRNLAAREIIDAIRNNGEQPNAQQSLD